MIHSLVVKLIPVQMMFFNRSHGVRKNGIFREESALCHFHSQMVKAFQHPQMLVQAFHRHQVVTAFRLVQISTLQKFATILQMDISLNSGLRMKMELIMLSLCRILVGVPVHRRSMARSRVQKSAEDGIWSMRSSSGMRMIQHAITLYSPLSFSMMYLLSGNNQILSHFSL